MTNFEKVLLVDKERFLQEVAEKICFDSHKHIVKIVQPPLCGSCSFGGTRLNDGKCKCHTDEILEWLKSEVEA